MDRRNIAEAITPKRGILRLKQGKIISSAGRVATITVGGDDTQIAVRAADHVTLTNGRACWFITDGMDALIIATVA